MARIIAAIPARMGSSRFPGKPLVPLCGRPMIEHVYRRTQMCKALADVCVATCDREIAAAVEHFGGKAVMTADTHERASDRIAEVAAGLDADIVVMVQGDEPLVRPEMIDLAVGPLLADPTVMCTNLATRIESEEEFADPNTIKVVMSRAGDALYFSRVPIPTRRLAFDQLVAYKQVCIIPFRRDYLLAYTRLAPTPLEIAESIDMLRILEHGQKVRLVTSPFRVQSVDTPADLARVEAFMRTDDLAVRYLREVSS